MAVRIRLFTQKAQDLLCKHQRRWAGALEGGLGDHLIALDCATCLSQQAAHDELTFFALYVFLISVRGAETVRTASAVS